jgi:5'-nucleotidase
VSSSPRLVRARWATGLAGALLAAALPLTAGSASAADDATIDRPDAGGTSTADGGAPSVRSQAAPDGSRLVINEAYVNGTAAGAAYTHRFVELFNPTDAPVPLGGLSLQYRSATGTAAATTVVPLTGTVAPGGYFLVRGSANSGTAGAELPAADQSATFASSGSSGTVVLARGTSALTLPTGDVKGRDDVLDLVGYGTSNTFETAPATGQGVALSLQRGAGADTDSNVADLAAAAPTPCSTAGCAGAEPDPEPDPEEVSIADVQGTGAASPLAGRTVTTTGVVTAAFPTGGFNGVYLQTGGTGGDADPTASHGVFVFGSAVARGVRVGDTVTVTGQVVEYNDLTEINATSFAVAEQAQPAVKPSPVRFPMGEAERERYEGMLVEPVGTYTITNNYSTHQYGEIGLAPGTEPLRQPTNEARPGTDAYAALVASNAAALVTLDDGASTNYLSAANQGTSVPWLTPQNEVRVGATTTFTEPVVLDYRFGWKLQPTAQLTADDAEGVRPVAEFSSTREAAPREVGGRLSLATFNVLNYFPTVGEEYAATTGATCSYYRDRSGANITVDDCGPTGPRGAANDASLARQEAKIVRAINDLDADVVSLEEIENSRHYGPDRDAALATLVAALNADAGAGTWAFVPSPAAVPEDEDVIRTAFIYRPAAVEPVGSSAILDDPRFANARQPLSQGFKPKGHGDDDVFAVIVNHFKSKGSGSGPDADTGDGQGASNYSRVRQSEALVEFATAEQQRLGTDKVFLTGDFNAYAAEDPIVTLEQAGYTDLADELTDEETYQFSGLIGSLDHVLATPAARAWVTGADVWNVNAYESIAREYSRYNANVTDLVDASAFRSSDHDPIKIGIDPGEPPAALTPTRTHAVATPLGTVATVTAKGGRPTGTVTLLRDGRELTKARLVLGVAYFSPLHYGFRTKGLSVRYDGDGRYAPSTSR